MTDHTENVIVPETVVAPETAKVVSVVINKKELFHALDLVKSTLKLARDESLLNQCLIEFDGIIGSIKATDFENFYCSVLSGNSTEPVKIFLDLKEVYDCVKTLMKKQFAAFENIILKLSRPEHWMLSVGETQIKEFQTKYQIKDYPVFPTLHGLKHLFAYSGEVLNEYFTSVKFATADESSRYTLNGVNIKGIGDGVRFEATNGKHLVRRELPSVGNNHEFEFILPTTPLKMLFETEGTFSWSMGSPVVLKFTEDFLTSCKTIGLMILTPEERDLFKSQTGLEFPKNGARMETCKIGLRAGWRIVLPNEKGLEDCFVIDDINNCLPLPGQSERFMCVTTNRETFLFKKLEGKWPKSDDVFPKNTPVATTELDPLKFLEILETSSSFLDKKKDWFLDFVFSETELTVKLKEAGKDYLPTPFVKTQTNAVAMTIRVNLDFFMEFLRAMKSANLTKESINMVMEFRDEDTAIIVKHYNVVYLIMPIEYRE